jgi:hypothetical protein
MMSLVACGIRPSIHAAYQAKASQMSISVTSVYNKLNAMESNVSVGRAKVNNFRIYIKN